MLAIRRPSTFLFFPFLLCGSAFAASNPDLSKVMSGLPVRFEANAGQHNSNIKFTAHTDGFSLFFTNRDVVFVPSGSKKSVTISLVEGNAAPAVEGLDPLSMKASYFTGNDKGRWTKGVDQFQRVRYAAVYSGVDLIYYGTGRQL